MENQWQIKLDALRAELPKLMKQAAQTLNKHLIGYIAGGSASEVSDEWRQGKTKSAFNPLTMTWSDDKLNIHAKSGALFQSFMEGKKNTLSKTEVSERGLTFTFGSSLPYARILDEGGYIHSKGRMHKWFWMMYYKSAMANPFFKIMAMHVMKTGSVYMIPRTYFSSGIARFNREGVQIWLEDVLNKIAEVWNA